jgi:Flp pilus assembly protein TadB
VGRYLLAILIIMVMGMIFSVVYGPNLLLFYAHLAGALVVIAYYTYSGRKKRQSEKRRR